MPSLLVCGCPQDADLPADAPVVVIFHGIAGDSSENYIRSFCTRVLREHRWRCVVYNRRGAVM